MNNEIGYGKRLRIARETAGLSVAAVAERLHLRSEIVLAIEKEDQEHTLAPAFIRGYIRTYSQLVLENGDELIELYNQHAKEEPKLTQLDKIESFPQNDGAMIRWGTITVSVILLLLVAIWLHDYLQAPNNETNAKTDLDAVAELSADDVMPFSSPESESSTRNSGLETDDIEQIVELVGSKRDEVSTDPTDIIQSEKPMTGLVSVNEGSPEVSELTNQDRNEIIPVAPDGNDRLLLTFVGASWIEVRDANGYRLIYGLFDQRDDQLTVRGSAPFHVTVGNAKVVEITVNDRKYGLRSHTRADNTARVLLGDKPLKPE